MEDQVRRFLELMAGEVDERHETPRAMLRRANHLRARSLLAVGVVGALLAYGGIAGMDFLSGQRERQQENNDMPPSSASPPATSECASLWDQTREAAREEGLPDGEARRLADEDRALCELQATRASEAVAHAREAAREAAALERQAQVRAMEAAVRAMEAAAREAAARNGEAAAVPPAAAFSCASDDSLRNAPPPVGDSTVVGVYFSCEADVGLPDQPLYLFVRELPSPSEELLPRLHGALTSYLMGPDQEEKDRGYLTALPTPIPEALESVSVEGDHATVNFSPVLESVNSLSAGTPSQVFLTELRRNVFQFAEIEHLTLLVAGDCERFWRMLEGLCQTLDRGG